MNVVGLQPDIKKNTNKLYCFNYWYYSAGYKNLFRIDDFTFFSIGKIIISRSMCAPVSHLTPCTPTKSNLYIVSSLATVVSEPDLFRLLTFHVPNLMNLFHCLGRPKGSVHAQATFRNQTCFRWRVVSTSPKDQAEGTPLVGFPRLFTQHFRSYSLYWRPFLHSQPVDAPYRSDRDPLIKGWNNHLSVFLSWRVCLMSESSGYITDIGGPNFDGSYD